MLPTVDFGNTDLKVTRLGYGSMDLRDLAGERSMPQSAIPGKLSSEKQAEVVLNTVLDNGINLLDTAWCYGRSEEFIGRFISHRRSEYFICSKAGHLFRNVSSESGWTKKALRTCVHESLVQLKTDYLDILMLHNPKPEDMENSDAVETLVNLKQQGKTRYIGISSGVPHIDYFLNLRVFDAIEVPYSVVMPENGTAIDRAFDNGVGVIVRGGLAEGVPFGGDPKRALYQRLKSRWDNVSLENLIKEENVASFMLRYTLSNSKINTVIVGTTNTRHIQDNAAAARLGPLDTETVATIADIVSGTH